MPGQLGRPIGHGCSFALRSGCARSLVVSSFDAVLTETGHGTPRARGTLVDMACLTRSGSPSARGAANVVGATQAAAAVTRALGAAVAGVIVAAGAGGCGTVSELGPLPITGESASRDVASAAALPASAATAPTLNARVLELIATYPDVGFGGYAWPARKGTSGTTRDLHIGGATIAHGGGGGDGNHCVGVTLEVFWRALEECPGGVAAAFGESASTASRESRARAFKRVWYVPVDRGVGSAEALPSYGFGERITRLDDARPGDFMQAWRADGLGHSMVFLGWQRDPDGTIVGVEYWSSQPWTDGIGRASTTIGVDEASFDPAQVYLARARCPTVPR
jgi:hypothetical protein